MLTDGHPGPRLLICGGPAFGDDEIGGLQHVLADLAGGLRRCGWHVDTLLGGRDEEASTPSYAFGQAGWQFRLGQAGRALHLPGAWRLPAGVLLRGRTRVRQLSAILYGTQRTIESGRYAAVLACPDGSPVGLAALVVRTHPRAVLVSLVALAFELRHSRSIRSARRAAHLVASGDVHPDLYSAVQPSCVRPVIFASRSWRDGAVDAGLPAAQSRVIHFGVPCPERLEEPHPPGLPARLLWAARLSPEKGLHLFLPALALLRRELPVRLTILSAPGPGRYRSRIERLIQRLRVADLIEHLPAVSREELPGVLASHDVLLFHSVFREPVAQMLLLAFAHGVIVVGPSSEDPRSLLRPAETAFCFANSSAHEIAATIRRAISDAETRRTVRERAFERVRTEHALAGTIAAYDALLREVADLPRAERPR